MKHTILAAALVMIGSSDVRADVLPWMRNSRPDLNVRPETASAGVPIRIETTKDGDQTRLLIPRKMLGSWQTALRNQDSHTAPLAGSPSLTVIGLSLAAAFSLAGFCLLRKPGPMVRGGLAVLVLLLLTPGVINVALATGSVGRSQTRPYQPDFQLSGPIVVEIVETGDAVRLILSKKSPLNLNSK